MAGRALQQVKTAKPAIIMPKTAADWDKLMKVVISEAASKGDRRIHGLRKALVDGKSERVLRMMGIIHTGDLPRVFPHKP